MAERVYHYTSLEALNGILKKTIHKDGGRSKITSYLNFWGSRYDSMNDPQDYLFATKVVLPKILKAIEHRDDIKEDHKEDNDAFPYIVSFSENRDDTSMWQHYKADVCLEIDTHSFSPWLTDNGIIKGLWGKCIYANEHEIDDKFFESWEKSLQYIEIIPSMARHACVFIKRKAFQQEKEWRLYIADGCQSHFKKNGESHRTEQPQDVNVKTIYNKDILFYKEFHIDAKALKGIIVNDTDLEHFHKVKKHIEVLLRSRGFYPEDISIEQTNMYPVK